MRTRWSVAPQEKVWMYLIFLCLEFKYDKVYNEAYVLNVLY